jgi:hypothetical protein
MTWLSIVATALSIIKAVIEWLHDRRMIDSAAAQETLKGIRDADAAIARAKTAREQVRAALARGSDAMSDDGYKRDD